VLEVKVKVVKSAGRVIRKGGIGGGRG